MKITSPPGSAETYGTLPARTIGDTTAAPIVAQETKSRPSPLKRRKRNKWVVPLAAAGAIAAAGGGGWVWHEAHLSDNGAAGLITDTAKRGDLIETVSATGSVSAQTGAQVNIGTQITGRIKVLDTEAILEYVKAGNLIQYGSQPYLKELISWLRFNKPEAMESLDGLYTRCSGSPQMPRWLGKSFMTGAGAGRQSDADATNIRSSSGLIVIASAQDDRRHWIETGRLYERLALTLATCNIKVAFINQPLEVPTLRAQFQSYLSLGSAQPQLLLRFGYADAMPRSLRRPIEQVLA